MSDLRKTGLFLRGLLAQEIKPPEMLVDQLLYQNTITMISADPGTGKSTVALNLACAVSSGQRVFGKLEVAQPNPVYYLAFETLFEEFQMVIAAMAGHGETPVVLNCENFWWDDGLLGLNVLDVRQVDALLKRIEAWQAPKLIIIDPLYMVVLGGLSEDKTGSAVAQFLLRLRRTFGAALLVLHHTKRQQHDKDGRPVGDTNPFYGSRWLDAVLHTNYHLKKRDDQHSGVTLEVKKDRLKACLPKLTLQYHAETMTCTLEESSGELPKRLFSLLAAYKLKGKVETDFYEVQTAMGCSQRQLARLVKLEALKQLVFLESRPGQRTCWRLK